MKIHLRLILFKKYSMYRLKLGTRVNQHAKLYNTSTLCKWKESIFLTSVSSRGLGQRSVHLKLRNCVRVGRGEQACFPIYD